MLQNGHRGETKMVALAHARTTRWGMSVYCLLTIALMTLWRTDCAILHFYMQDIFLALGGRRIMKTRES